MVDVLRVNTVPAPDDAPYDYRVNWATGTRMQGILLVTLPYKRINLDSRLVAELAAMHHLLCIAAANGNDRCGQSLEITCSHPEIPLLQTGDAEETFAAKYATFLRIRFADAKISVGDSQWINPHRAALRVTSIKAPSACDEQIEFHGVGPVILTHHVIERFAQRNVSSSLSEAWKDIRKLAKSSRMIETQPDEATADTNLMKYGRVPRVLRSGPWRFVIIEDDTGLKAVTVIFSG